MKKQSPRRFLHSAYCDLLRKLKPFLERTKLTDRKAHPFSLTLDGSHVNDPKNPSRLWFHAASVGELESLWPLIQDAARKNAELILSVFSPSAAGSLKKLKAQLISEHKATILYSGYSPWEGEWGAAVETLQPDFFITAKYEAWPDLWASLARHGVPLAIVGAKSRSSLKIARRFSLFFTGKIPELFLFPYSDVDCPDLITLFPNATVVATGEPRWERVYARFEKGNERAQHLAKRYENYPRPWGILGSAWPEDLKFLQETLRKLPGTVWVVPHQLDPENLRTLESQLKEFGLAPQKTTASVHPPTETATETDTVPPSRPCLLVDEMGFLSELYSIGDWAFVGGGFRTGVHSTIEPAIYGIPIASGPEGGEKFSEIQELCHSGQLRIIKSPEQLADWENWILSSQPPHQKVQWKQEAEARRGATRKIMELVEQVTNSNRS